MMYHKTYIREEELLNLEYLAVNTTLAYDQDRKVLVLPSCATDVSGSSADVPLLDDDLYLVGASNRSTVELTNVFSYNHPTPTTSLIPAAPASSIFQAGPDSTKRVATDIDFELR
jgi:hypothetical protein